MAIKVNRVSGVYRTAGTGREAQERSTACYRPDPACLPALLAPLWNRPMWCLGEGLCPQAGVRDVPSASPHRSPICSDREDAPCSQFGHLADRRPTARRRTRQPGTFLCFRTPKRPGVSDVTLAACTRARTSSYIGTPISSATSRVIANAYGTPSSSSPASARQLTCSLIALPSTTRLRLLLHRFRAAESLFGSPASQLGCVQDSAGL